jgi:hypothetical protein
MAKNKSLKDVAKAILMKEDAAATPNGATLHPGAGANAGSEPDPKHNEAALIATAPVKPGEGENAGAAAAAPVGKDTSKSASSPNAGESFGLKEDEVDEDIEISEELSQFIEAKIAEGLTNEQIEAAIAENFEIVAEGEDVSEDEAKEIAEAALAKAKSALSEASKAKLNEHVTALVEGENLSEAFKSKASTIFETAVSERLAEETAVLEENYKTALAAEVTKLNESLSKKVSDFLDHVVEQWAIDNQVALDSGLRNELTEEFIGGLRTLFTEHYIDVPEDKVNVVEQLGEKVAGLETKLNEEIAKNVELSKTINEARQTEFVSKLCEGLTTVQSEKLKGLAENVEFVTPENFEGKVKALKESYFPVGTPNGAKALDNEPVGQPKGAMLTEGNDRMSRYVKTLGKLK